MRLRLAAPLLMLMLWTVQAIAAGGHVDGPDGRRVHYGTMNTASLDPEVAQRLQVKPDQGRALVVLSPRDAQGHSIAATAEGRVRRLTGQSQDLAFRESGTSGQRDLIAQFDIQNGERLVFEIDVRMEGLSYPLQIRFNQPFYRDP